MPIGCARSRHVLVSILLYAHLVRLAASARPMPRLECGPSSAPALDQDLTAQTSVWFKRRIVAGEWDGYFFAVAVSPSSSTAGAGRAGMRRAGAEAPAWVFSACAALHDVQRTAPRLERGAVRVAGVTCLAWCPVCATVVPCGTIWPPLPQSRHSVDDFADDPRGLPVCCVFGFVGAMPSAMGVRRASCSLD